MKEHSSQDLLDLFQAEHAQNVNNKYKTSNIARLKSQVVFRLPPSYVQVEMTTKCNLKCAFCKRSKEFAVDMQQSLFKSIIDQLRRYRLFIKTLDLTGLGEPLLCEHLIPSIMYAQKYGFTVRLISNFTAVDQTYISNLIKSQLDCLYVSFDGVSKETYERIRIGASFEKVLGNMKLFISTRNKLNRLKPRLLLRPTIYPDNLNEIPQFFKLARMLKVDGLVFGDYVNRTKFDEIKVKSTELSFDGPQKGRKIINLFNFGKDFPPCITGCYISFDGRVLPCGYLTQMVPREDYSQLQLGDLKQNTLSEIWFGRKYKQFKTKIISCNPYPRCSAIAKCYQHH